jgi:uncharacterized protein YneF (UPF0154 family)
MLMKLIKNIKNHINFTIGITFIVGILTGSYITRHDNSLSVFLLNQRANIIIALLTGVISGYVVSLYFDSKQKKLESKEFVRLFKNYLIIFKRGIIDFLESDIPSVFEQYPIGENTFGVSFDKYEGYISEEMKPLIKKALEIVQESKSSYNKIKIYSESNTKSLIEKEKYDKNIFSTEDSKGKLSDKIDDEIKNNIINISIEKAILSESSNKIQDLIIQIHELSTNI